MQAWVQCMHKIPIDANHCLQIVSLQIVSSCRCARSQSATEVRSMLIRSGTA